MAKKKPSKLQRILTIVALVLLVILVAFYSAYSILWNGLKEEVVYAAGNCVESYTHYTVEPELKTIYYCDRSKNEVYDPYTNKCTISYFYRPQDDDTFARKNFLKCLCADPEREKYATEIVEHYEMIYKKYEVGEIVETVDDYDFYEGRSLQLSTELDVICAELQDAVWPISDY